MGNRLNLSGSVKAWLIACLLVVAAGGDLAAAGRAESPVATRTIAVFGLKGPTSIGMLPLFEAPPDLGSGVRTVVEAVGSPDLAVVRLLSGEADFAFLPINLAANLYNRGAPLLLAAITGGGMLYVVTSRSDVRSVRDLAGKTLYNSSRGSAPEFIMDTILERNGIDPKTGLTQLFTYNHTELASALAAGRIDLAVLPEPFVSIALAKNSRLRIAIDLQRAWSALAARTAADGGGGAPVGGAAGGAQRAEGVLASYPLTALVVQRSLSERSPSVVERFLAAERTSMAWVIAHPSEAGRLAERYLGMPASAVASSIPRLSLAFVPAVKARASVDRFLAVLYSFDPRSIGGRMPDERFFLAY